MQVDLTHEEADAVMKMLRMFIANSNDPMQAARQLDGLDRKMQTVLSPPSPNPEDQPDE